MSFTPNLDLEKPIRGASGWAASWNDNADKIDATVGTVLSNINDLPECYRLTGTFNGTTGITISLPKSVDAVNEYGVKVTPTSRSAAIGDIWVTPATNQFTVHCAEANTTDTFLATVYYVGDVSTYGGAIYRRFYASPDTSISDHSVAATFGSIAYMISLIGGTPAVLELPGNRTYTLTAADVTLPSNIMLLPQPGAVVNVGSGRTFTVPRMMAGNQQVFSGSGTAIVTDPSVIRNPKWWGSVGDGATDDTAALQAALNCAGIVRGNFGETYLVDNVGTKTYRGVQHNYCLLIPSNCFFDFNGCTLKLADGANSHLFVNSDIDGSGNENIRIRGGIIDGNQVNQTSPATGSQSCGLLNACTNVQVTDIRYINVRMWALLATGIEDGVFRDLHCKGSDGDAFYFGVSDPDTLRMTRCTFENLRAEDCLGEFGVSSAPGHPFSLVGSRCFIDKIEAKDCMGPIRVSLNGSTENVIGKLIATGTGTNGHGVMIRGYDSTTDRTTRINISEIITADCAHSGVWITYCDQILIGRIQSSEDGTAGSFSAIAIDDVKELSICQINVYNAGSSGVYLSNTVKRVSIDTVYVKNSGQVVSGQSNMLLLCDTANINAIMTLDDQTGVETAAYGINITSDANEVLIGKMQCHGDFTSAPIIISNYRTFIGPCAFSADPVGGVVTLTNGATSTPVANANIWREYMGGASDYLHPIIEIIPWSASAAALSPRVISVVDRTSGSGFTIGHATAGASDRVYWRLAGYQTLPSALS